MNRGVIGEKCVRHGQRGIAFAPSAPLSRISTLLVVALVALTLVFGGMPAATPAWADEVSDAQAALDQAELRMQDIVEQYETLQSELAAIQQRLDDTASETLEAQSAVLAGREALGKSAVYEYRGGTTSLLLTLVLESSNFDELVRNVSYLNAIVQYQADEVAAQKERTDRLSALSAQLNTQKASQEAKLVELDQKRAEADQVLESARGHLQNAQAAEATRLAALEQEAQRLTAQEQASSGTIDENANTVDREEAVPEGTPVTPDPDPNPPSGSTGSGSSGSTGGASGSGSGSTNTGGWQTGVASAYGGSTDSYTPNPGTTATGAVCDDWSMGVAVPMAWSNYRSYFGRTVEISYGGMTVYAVVNDCGYMGAGSRALDLQPGVWKAFGYSSCNAWGLRTVSYRFL